MYDLLLKHKDLQNAEIEWRLARACRVLAENCVDHDTKKKLTYEALEHAKLALDLDDKNYASHKWYAIALSIVGDYEGKTAKLKNSEIMKDHFEVRFMIIIGKLVKVSQVTGVTRDYTR